MNCTDSDIRKILTDYRHFTVYGLSPNSDKPSQRVPLFMKSKGYDAVGIYPGEKEISGFKIYPDLKSVPMPYRKFVDVFQRPDRIPGIVEEVIQAGGVEILWLQLGITHPEAERRAEMAGIKVVSDRCLHIEYEKHLG